MPQFVDESAKIIAVIVGLVGLFFNGFQIRANTRQRRAQYITDFLNIFWSDPDILEAYYQIEYSEFKYTPDFHKSVLERKMDRLLECLGGPAKLYCVGLLSLEDISLLQYEYLVVYQDVEVKKYFEFVDTWYEERGFKCRSFSEFRSVSEHLEKLHFGDRPNISMKVVPTSL